MDLLLDSNNDLDITNNRIRFTRTSSELIKQRIHIKLNTNKGEWKFNTLFGLPWITSNNEKQLIGKQDRSFVDATVKEAIRSTEGVVEISEFSSSLDTKVRSYTLQVRVKLINNTTVQIFEELAL